MSFLTEYFDEYREHPIKKTTTCRPENRWAKLDGKWLDTGMGTQKKAWTEEEIEAFIKATMKSMRGQSTYYNDFCAHLPQDLKTRPFQPRVKVLRPCAELEAKTHIQEAAPTTEFPKMHIKDTELMKVAKELYERDPDKPTLEPLPTHLRMAGYVRPRLYRTGISDYQGEIARLAYEMVRDDRIPRYHAHNGCRPRWGLPPEGTRQPELDAAPFDGERLY